MTEQLRKAAQAVFDGMRPHLEDCEAGCSGDYILDQGEALALRDALAAPSLTEAMGAAGMKGDGEFHVSPAVEAMLSPGAREQAERIARYRNLAGEPNRRIYSKPMTDADVHVRILEDHDGGTVRLEVDSIDPGVHAVLESSGWTLVRADV